MKKIIFIISILIMAVSLSGCVKLKQTSKNDGGVFKSVDAGETWHQKVFISRQKSEINTIGDVTTYFMQFDPQDKNTLYLMTAGKGIYQTNDAGETWSSTSLSSGTYSSLAIDPSSSGIFYATKNNTILKSTDGMQTWDTIYVEQRPNQSINSLAIDPYNTSKIYAVTNTGLLGSSDYGNTWKVIQWLKSNNYQLYINKKDSKIMYFITKNDGLMKSTDGGENWQGINKDLEKLKGAKNINFYNFMPNEEVIFIATDYGIFKSTNSGENWTAISTLVKGLPIRTVAVNPQNQNEIYITVDNVVHKSVDGGTNWKTIRTVSTSRKINFILIDPQNPDIIYLGAASPPK